MRLLTFWMSALFIFTLSGCLKEDFPVIENIKKGSKWNLHIGDSYADVYKNLQKLGIEKGFSSFGLVYRTPYSNPKELRRSLPFYNLLTIESSAGRVDRVIIKLADDHVTSLSAGGALPEEVNQWPQRAMEGAIILRGYTIDELYAALEGIYNTPAYAGYKYILPDKPLDLPFDPGMKDYNEWAFTFFNDQKVPGKDGRSQVRLHFKDGKLDRIHHVYDEFEVVH